MAENWITKQGLNMRGLKCNCFVSRAQNVIRTRKKIQKSYEPLKNVENIHKNIDHIAKKIDNIPENN